MYELSKLKIKSLISKDALSFSPLEGQLSEAFNMTPEALRELILETETVEELMETLDKKD